LVGVNVAKEHHQRRHRDASKVGERHGGRVARAWLAPPGQHLEERRHQRFGVGHGAQLVRGEATHAPALVEERLDEPGHGRLRRHRV
jgi:hypothetical protein